MMLKFFFLLLSVFTAAFVSAQAQPTTPTAQQRNNLIRLIADYAKARENKDTVLLKRMLTNDVDQLVSTGEWRTGLAAAVQGMLESSTSSPGTRTLKVDKIRLLTATCAVVDCRYDIQNKDSTTRNMWSTFLVVATKARWKIAAIRNMLPSKP